jgi:hypothetical protein
MDLYSPLLAIAMVAAIPAALLCASTRVRAWWGADEKGRARRLAALRSSRYLGMAGVVLALTSGLSHVLMGHRPGSTSALAPIAFLGAHPAWVAVLFLSVATLVFSRDSEA